MRHSLILATALAVLIPLGCTTTELADATRVGLLATGNDSEKNLALVNAGEKMANAALPMSYEDERALGGSVAIASFEKYGSLLNNAEVQRYVTLVGLTVAAKTNRPDVPFRFAVVDSDDVNAWAAPGGYIFLTKGALVLMEDEAQLAGVLGHEIAHVCRYHMVTMLQRGRLLSAAAEGASAFGGDSARIASGVNGGLDVLFEKGYDRKMEYEADVVGMDYAAAAGYDPTGLRRYLTGLEKTGSGKGGGWLESTHPDLVDRVTGLDTAYANGYQELGGAVQKERFAAMTKSLR
ncbi:M48 family metalloprotease [bacterium]|nr:M48 family metalloprotease [bacterium]